MATLHVVTGDQYRTIDQRMREIKRQLDQQDGSPLNPGLVASALQQIVEGKFYDIEELVRFCEHVKYVLSHNVMPENVIPKEVSMEKYSKKILPPVWHERPGQAGASTVVAAGSGSPT